MMSSEPSSASAWKMRSRPSSVASSAPIHRMAGPMRASRFMSGPTPKGTMVTTAGRRRRRPWRRHRFGWRASGRGGRWRRAAISCGGGAGSGGERQVAHGQAERPWVAARMMPPAATCSAMMPPPPGSRHRARAVGSSSSQMGRLTVSSRAGRGAAAARRQVACGQIGEMADAEALHGGGAAMPPPPRKSVQNERGSRPPSASP